MSLLAQPLTVGPVSLRNRIVFPAHLTNFAVDGRPTDQHAAYYAARAAGGAALIITEEHTTDPDDRPYEKLIRGFDPASIPGYRRITSAVHAHGAVILAQLNHNGAQSSGRYSRRPLCAPSPVPDPLFREVPRAVDHDDIRRIVAGYARAAAHVADGGFDGVELQCSQSSILRQFLSPATNHRTDAYGGPPAARARILRETVAAVRAVLGPALVLGVRICGDELIEHGTTPPDAVELARLLEADGGLDYVNTAIGVATATLPAIVAPMPTPAGYADHIPAAIRAAVRLPVIGTGRFTRPEQVEQALAGGVCDLVGVVRGQIADPDFARRAVQSAAVRTCLGCNQECVGRVGTNRRLGCVVNPRAGRESRPPATVGRRARTVVVVGAGPAGLQAACGAAERGHRVSVLERAAQPGGQLRLAAAVASRAALLDLVGHLTARALRAGVRIDTGVEATADDLRAAGPDAVVLATGARPVRPSWADTATQPTRAGDRPLVVDVRAVLDGTAAPSGRVVVLDEVGFHPATSVAEELAGRGCAVEIVTSALVVGQDLDGTLDLRAWTVHVHALGVRQRTDVIVTGLRDGGLAVQQHATGTRAVLRCDWVVCALPAAPDDALWRALRGAPFEVHRIGDCLAPRRAHAAVIEGERIGARL